MSVSKERRAATRFRSSRIASAFGEVVDVSATGMAVVHRGRAVALGAEIELSIGWNGEFIDVPCRVRRVEPVGFRRQRIALEWTRTPGGLAAWLGQPRSGGTECSGPQVYELPASA